MGVAFFFFFFHILLAWSPVITVFCQYPYVCHAQTPPQGSQTFSSIPQIKARPYLFLHISATFPPLNLWDTHSASSWLQTLLSLDPVLVPPSRFPSHKPAGLPSSRAQRGITHQMTHFWPNFREEPQSSTNTSTGPCCGVSKVMGQVVFSEVIAGREGFTPALKTHGDTARDSAPSASSGRESKRKNHRA